MYTLHLQVSYQDYALLPFVDRLDMLLWQDVCSLQQWYDHFHLQYE